MIVGLCDRFKALPSQVRQEEAGIIGMLKIYDMGHVDEEDE